METFDRKSHDTTYQEKRKRNVDKAEKEQQGAVAVLAATTDSIIGVFVDTQTMTGKNIESNRNSNIRSFSIIGMQFNDMKKQHHHLQFINSNAGFVAQHCEGLLATIDNSIISKNDFYSKLAKESGKDAADLFDSATTDDVLDGKLFSFTGHLLELQTRHDIRLGELKAEHNKIMDEYETQKKNFESTLSVISGRKDINRLSSHSDCVTGIHRIAIKELGRLAQVEQTSAQALLESRVSDVSQKRSKITVIDSGAGGGVAKSAWSFEMPSFFSTTQP